jgi:hypothetical protein
MLLTFFPGFRLVLIIEEIFQGVKKMEVSISQMVSETVRKIEGLISDISGLQSAYVEHVCSKCEAPCCTRVHYLFSEKDILYSRLSGRKHGWRREAFTKKGCWFLGPTGCFLAPQSRPFICHSYICPDLKAEIRRNSPDLLADLEAKFKLISMLRSQMWAEYLDVF